MKKRILFVDDEPRILEGLQNLLRRQRRKWEMTFVDSGQAALDELKRSPYDVIVTDMRMPRMDGATLLNRVQRSYPQVVRIVLSGHAELEAALRAVPVAHQFLTKPCEPKLLETVIERACNLQQLIDDELVRRMVGRIDKLPATPRIYSELMGALADPNVTAAKIARVVEQDIAMCAKLLQLVNSSFFRLHRRITKVEEAISYLGFNMVKHLALTVEVFGDGLQGKATALSLERLQQHCMVTANIAVNMFTDDQQRQDAFIAALLHDIGKLIVALELPEEMARIVAVTRAERTMMHQVEERLTGISHAEVGAYLLGLWGLPYPIIEAVANHHNPTRVSNPGFDLVAAIHISDVLAGELLPVGADGVTRAPQRLERDYLEGLGVSSKLPKWREIAVTQARRLSS